MSLFELGATSFTLKQKWAELVEDLAEFATRAYKDGKKVLMTVYRQQSS
jgi:hypothetical protein